MQLQANALTVLYSFGLVLIALFISYRQKLGNIKEILYSVTRAIIQLAIVGYILKYLFSLNNALVTIGMVIVIALNAAWNAHKRSQGIPHTFIVSLIAIFLSAAVSLSILLLSGSVKFIPSQVVPISGMICGNAMTAIGLCYRNMNTMFRDQHQQVLEKLSLGASPLQASRSILKEVIQAGTQPTMDSAKTLGIVFLPGMMSGLMFAGADPTQAVLYQIMITFMLVGTTTVASFTTTYLAYRGFYNENKQLTI